MGPLRIVSSEERIAQSVTMQIFVKTFERTVAVDVAACDTVNAVKASVEAREGVKAAEQVLTFGGRVLESEETLESYGVSKESTLDLTLRLVGGKGKRKKKVYSTPKKIKHVHKNVKLRVLKYYQVDENNKITRLRRECNEAECGAGVFFAAHKDRLYCGKCHLTIKL